MKFQVSDVVWDTDGEDVDLPFDFIIEADNQDVLADAISDKYGFCHKSFQFEPVETKFASKKIMDSYWFLEYEEHFDKSITILAHWRDQAPAAVTFAEFVNQTRDDNFQIIEGDGPSRIAFQVRLGKFDGFRGTWEDERLVAVRNANGIFSYGGPRT